MKKPNAPQRITDRHSLRDIFKPPWGGCIIALLVALLGLAYLILSGCAGLGMDLGKVVSGTTVTIVLGEMDSSPDALAASAAVFEGVLQAKRRRGVTDCVGYPVQSMARWRPAIGQPWRTAGPLVDPAAVDPRTRWAGMPTSGNVYPYSERQGERGYQNAEALWLAATVLRAGGPNLVGLRAAGCNGIPSGQEAVDAAYSLPGSHPVFRLATISASWRVTGLRATAVVTAPPYGPGVQEMDWGDGTKDTMLQHEYLSAGTFTVKATALDAGGFARQVSARITVVGSPPAPRCGDGHVDPGETCESCPLDAGACPPQPHPRVLRCSFDVSLAPDAGGNLRPVVGELRCEEGGT